MPFSHLIIEKAGEKLIDRGGKGAVFWRDGSVIALSYEELYLLLTALPLYPRTSAELYYDREMYPAKQVISDLTGEFGPAGDEKYSPPAKLRIDAIAEAKPRNLDELNKYIDELQRRMDARAYAPNWQREFTRMKHNATCIDGDRAYFKRLAQSALDEDRVQIASVVNSLRSGEEVSMICFGIAIAASDILNPYRRSDRSGDFDRTEERLVTSYV